MFAKYIDYLDRLNISPNILHAIKALERDLVTISEMEMKVASSDEVMRRGIGAIDISRTSHPGTVIKYWQGHSLAVWIDIAPPTALLPPELSSYIYQPGLRSH